MEEVTDLILTIINKLIDKIRDGCRSKHPPPPKKNGHGKIHVQEYTFRSKQNLQNKNKWGMTKFNYTTNQ